MEKQAKIDYGKKAILISRVSTPQQCLAQDLMPQLEDLKTWAEGLGYTEFYPIGTTESGFLKEDDKQGWNLITDILKKDPSCRVIICTEISRLSRLQPILFYIRDYLVEHKIQLLIKDIGFTLLNDYGEVDMGKDLIFSLFSSLASSEMRTKKERFKRALKEYRKLGYSIGGKELFGYSRSYNTELGGKIKKSIYSINEVEAEEIRTIYKWYAYGIDGDMRKPSVLRITKECIARGFSKYLHSKRNVNKCLKEQAYLGYKKTSNKKKNPEYWNYKQLDKPKYIECEEYECKYPQIIEESLFNAVRDIMQKRNSHNVIDSDEYVDKSSKHTTILAKMIVCPDCGKYLVGEYRTYKSIKKHTYRCPYSRSAVRICSYKTSSSLVLLDSAIWAYAKSTIAFIVSKKNILFANQNIDELKKSIKRLKEKSEQFDNEIDTASIVFSNKMKSSRTEERKNKVREEYEQKVKKIERERESYDRDIIQKEKQLHDLERQNKSLTGLVDKDVSYIENNKLEMYNYIHLIIDKIIPLFSDKQYTCLQIITFKEKGNNGFYLDFNHSQSKEKLNDCEYLILNKKDANRIKMKIVSGSVQWDSTLNKFVYSIKNNVRVYEYTNEEIEERRKELKTKITDNSLIEKIIEQYKNPIKVPEYGSRGEEVGSIEDFFSKDFKTPSEIDVEDLEYKRLTFYEEDEVKK